MSELIQITVDMKAEKTREREVKALWKAMDETQTLSATIITCEDEEEIMAEGKTIRVIPAYRYLFPEASPCLSIS